MPARLDARTEPAALSRGDVRTCGVYIDHLMQKYAFRS